jgi:Raf kinase inhibitor-like YbhB/YbcL family protein
MPFLLNSPAFGDGEPIPTSFTQDGDNVSPPLEWRDPPPGTQSFVLVLDDPDAPTGHFHHWAVYDIARDRTSLPQGAGSTDSDAWRLGINDYGRRAYDGPAPPEGHGPHTYHFLMAALRVPHLEVSPSTTAVEIWEAAQVHAIRYAEVVGTYERRAAGTIEEPPPPVEETDEDRYIRARPPSAQYEEVRRQPDKGDPVIVAGDAGGPGDGRNITTADLDHDAGKPRPNELEPNIYAADKPRRRPKES